MSLKLVPRGALAATVGVTFAVVAAAGPSAAFTLSAPPLAASGASTSVERVWWDRWGRWRPNRPWGWRRWGGPGPYGWGYPRPYGFYGAYGPVRRCWIGPWGGVRCRWG